tara:strand:- start:8043 stop:8192 length:150 start_codon:yes stop_codon:yes gene_type:complete
MPERLKSLKTLKNRLRFDFYVLLKTKKKGNQMAALSPFLLQFKKVNHQL